MTARAAAYDPSMIHLNGDRETRRGLMAKLARSRSGNMRRRLAAGDRVIMAGAAYDRRLRVIDDADIGKKCCLMTTFALVGGRGMRLRLPRGNSSVVTCTTLSWRILEPTKVMAGFARGLSMRIC